MTDKEFIEKVKQVTKEYCEDEDHWSSFFMEKIVDLITEYERSSN